MKKILVFAFILSLLLSGCVKETLPPTGPADMHAVQDYNDFMFNKGDFTWTRYGIYTVVKNRIRYLNENDEWKLLCFKEDCMHQDETCDSYIETSSLYAYDEHLYYVSYTDNEFILNRADLSGKNREQVKKLEIHETQEISRHSYQIAGNYLVLEYTYANQDISQSEVTIDRKSVIYLTTLEKDTPVEKISSDYTYICSLSKYWLFLYETDYVKGCYSIKGYNLETGKEITILDDASTIGRYIATIYNPDADTFYWFQADRGFMKMNADELIAKVIKQTDSRITIGSALYDDKYIYVTNAIPSTGNDEIPLEKRGIYIYDHNGEYKDFISTSNMRTGISYAFNANNKFYLSIGSAGSLPTLFYFNKEDIGSGSLAWTVKR